MEVGTYHTEAFQLQNGQMLADAQLTYATFGKLNTKGDNAVLFPTWFTGTHENADWLIGSERSLDPDKYFIIVPDMLGNGQSSSPNNTAPPHDRMRFPQMTLLDNVRLQREMLREELAVERLALVVGRSMGAQIAFQWGSYFADEVERILPICGSARTSPHNYIFLAAVKGALTSDPHWQGGEYRTPPLNGLRAMRTIYDGWVLSQSFYRANLHLKMGFETTQAYLDRLDTRAPQDANNVLAQIWTWQNGDISANDRFKGNISAALGSIAARAIVMPCRHDLYFPPEDSEVEVAQMPNATLRVIESIWGHRAGAPGTDPEDIAFLDRAIGELLDSPPGVMN